MDENNLILVKQHFRSNGHDFNKNAKLIIIERTEKYINTKSIIEKNQDKGLKSRKTYILFRFIMKQNHLTLK